jgi:hypothetical protein
MRTLFAVAVLCLAVSAADARPRHHYRHHHHARQAAAPPVSGRPAPCRGIPWCGCWLRLRYGMADTRLNLARAWAGLGSPAKVCRPGLVAVWPHHVGEITECLGGGMVRMISGNDGSAVRDRVRLLGRATLRAL